MSSCTTARIVGNHDNAIRTAILSATAQRPSTDIRLVSKAAAGRGRVLVTTPGYTGASDSIIEAEVLSTAGGTLRTSAPVVRGVGSGTLNVTSIASGAATQKLTFTLANPGDPADKARLDFYGVALVAKTAGAAGNALTLTVTRNLVKTELPFATLEDISANTASWTGEQWNWGGVSEQNGGIPATAPRIQFAGFPQVHRAYKKWVDGKWEHKIDPAPAYSIPKGTRLLAVSGNYTLNLSGETYTATTLYDFLKELQARSLLVDIDGTVAEDRAPGGMAVTDIPLNTDAHALPAQRTTKNGKGSVSAVTVGVAAPTENVTLTCLKNSSDWSVVGDVSGRIGTATTGAPFFSSVLGFKIDAIADAVESTGKISAKAEFTGRSSGEGLPSICFNPLRLGAKATDKTITFTYTERPPADCPCTGAAVGIISDKCLGLPGEEIDNMNPAFVSRLKAVYAWRETAVRANTAYYAGVAGTPPTPGTPPVCPPSTPGTYFYKIRIPVGGFTAEAKIGGFATNAAAAADKNAFGTGVTVTSGLDVAAASVTFSNGKSAVLLFAPGTGLSMVGATATAVNYIDYDLSTGGGSCTGGTPGTPGTPGICATFKAAVVDLNWIESSIGILIPCLNEVIETATAVTKWDSLWTEVQADLAHLLATTDDDVCNPNPRYLDRYRATCDNIKLEAGIFPKSNASTIGDGCWLDDTSATGYWVADDPDLLPMFSNKVYISSTLIDGKAFSTQEFGLGPEVTCPERLKFGDKIIVKIGNTASATGYVVGDVFIIPLVRGAAATFAGGTDTDPTQTWAVFSSTAGTQPDWSYNPTAPAPYVGLITAALVPGGIPFETGDSIAVSIEGGTMRWRRDSGTWATVDLYATTTLGDGLNLSASPAASPSFVAGDLWTYKAIATYGLDNLRQPRVGKAYAWDGASSTITINLGAVTDCPLVMLALHNLPATATVTLDGLPVAHHDGIMFHYLAGRTASTLTLSITGAGAGGAIGWLYAGNGWIPTVTPSTLKLNRQYAMLRGNGINPAALYRGKGNGGQWAWNLGDKGAIDRSNAKDLLTLVDYSMSQGGEPVALITDVRLATSGAVAILDTDNVSMTDTGQWQAGGEPWVEVDLPFRAVLT